MFQCLFIHLPLAIKSFLTKVVCLSFVMLILTPPYFISIVIVFCLNLLCKRFLKMIILRKFLFVKHNLMCQNISII